MNNPYEVLGISRNADMDEIKRAYRKRAKECHPDLHPNDPTAKERMQQVNEAYDRLCHPEKYRDRIRPESDGPHPYNLYAGAGYTGRRYTDPQGTRYYYTFYSAPEWRQPRQEQPRTAVARPFRSILRVMGYILIFRFIMSILRFGFFGFF